MAPGRHCIHNVVSYEHHLRVALLLSGQRLVVYPKLI